MREVCESEGRRDQQTGGLGRPPVHSSQYPVKPPRRAPAALPSLLLLLKKKFYSSLHQVLCATATTASVGTAGEATSLVIRACVEIEAVYCSVVGVESCVVTLHYLPCVESV